MTAYSILSSQGKVLEAGMIKQQQFDINTSGLSAGVYILLLKGNNQNITMKFVK